MPILRRAQISLEQAAIANVTQAGRQDQAQARNHIRILANAGGSVGRRLLAPNSMNQQG